MKRHWFLGLVFLLAAGQGVFAVEDWWWDYQAENGQVPSDQVNKDGNQVCAVTFTSPNAEVTWNNLGGDPPNYSMRLNNPTENTKYYWRYESGVYDWVAPMDGYGNYTVDFRMKVNSISVAPDLLQNNAMAWFLGFQRMEPDDGSVATSVKSRLYVSDRPKIGDGKTIDDWGPVTPGVVYIYDDDLNNIREDDDYMRAHWAVNLGEWFTLRYSICTLPGETTSNVWVWLNGELVSTWDDKPINTATNQHDYYLGFNDRKHCAGDIELDYFRVAGKCYDIDGNDLCPVVLAGDLNNDGMVSSADLDIVRANWGQTVEAGCLPCGDPSGDGMVGSADLDIVRANWGATSAAAVPEPCLLALFAAAFVLLPARRRR